MHDEINNAASPKSGSLAEAGPKWLNKVARFVRITGLLVLLASAAGIILEGWPHGLRAAGNLQGLSTGAMLVVMSFRYVATGRTRIILKAATFILAALVIGFSLAMLCLPHF